MEGGGLIVLDIPGLFVVKLISDLLPILAQEGRNAKGW